MSDGKAPKTLRLKFKGEKSKKKRKRDEDDEGTSSSRRGRHNTKDDGSPEQWVHLDQATELRGPTFIFHPSDPSPICISYDATRNRIALHPLEKPEDGVTILDRTPSEVSQVWVTTRVAGASTINLRTGVGEGKFLSCDKHGLVTADREARGPQEEWTPVVLEGGMVAFMNVYEKYLSIDEVAGGQLALRGDSDNMGFQERFYVKIQNKYKQEAYEEERKKGGGLDQPSLDEKGTKWVLYFVAPSSHVTSCCSSATFQAWGAGRSVVSKGDKKEVRRPPRSQGSSLLTLIFKAEACAQGGTSSRSSSRSPREIEKVCTFRFTTSIGHLSALYAAIDSARFYFLAITTLSVSISEFLPEFVVPPYNPSHRGREPDETLRTPPNFAIFTLLGPSYPGSILHLLPSGAR